MHMSNPSLASTMEHEWSLSAQHYFHIVAKALQIETKINTIWYSTECPFVLVESIKLTPVPISFLNLA